MFERIDYRVIRIDGEYAYLQKLEDENAEEGLEEDDILIEDASVEDDEGFMEEEDIELSDDEELEEEA